jgi:hypothetical protein
MFILKKKVLSSQIESSYEDSFSLREDLEIVEFPAVTHYLSSNLFNGCKSLWNIKIGKQFIVNGFIRFGFFFNRRSK